MLVSYDVTLEASGNLVLTIGYVFLPVLTTVVVRSLIKHIV